MTKQSLKPKAVLGQEHTNYFIDDDWDGDKGILTIQLKVSELQDFCMDAEIEPYHSKTAGDSHYLNNYSHSASGVYIRGIAIPAEREDDETAMLKAQIAEMQKQLTDAKLKLKN